MSALIDQRRKYLPKTSSTLQHLPSMKNPLRIGVVFSGGQAPGGHNVIAGLFDALQEMNSASQLIGFLNGPSGIVENHSQELSSQEVDLFRNTGGFDLLGSGRTKIETEEQMANSLATCKSLNLDGLVVIGGDDSNTNAALLAEYFTQNGSKISVVGIPKTIDGDLQSKEIEISFGFDSACKTYSEMIGNIAKDAISSKKYYHFIKLMGRSASHITLECAMATQPNLALIGEERKKLEEIVQEIADLICARSLAKKDYGVILIPEGLIEFIPELMPEKLNLEKDPHGNIPLSQIKTEELLINLTKKELEKRSAYKGKFTPLPHFLGYEGRSCFPSNFDANYCYTLGKLAASAIRDQKTGVICSIQNLKEPPDKWRETLVPIKQLIHLEVRNGKEKPVIKKALVDLEGKVFQRFAKQRGCWKMDDAYRFPGPIQFFGPAEISDSFPQILEK